MILLVTVLLVVMVLAFVGYPLLRPSISAPPPSSPVGEQRARLLIERENALSTLTDLELEHSIGNLSDQDYTQLQGAQRHKAVAILRELDRVDASPAGMDQSDDDTSLDAALEAEIARARQRLIGTGPAAVDAGQAGKTGGAGGASGVSGVTRIHCPACGAAQAPTARYCTACGGAIASTLTCPACGTPRAAGDSYCAGCGAALDGAHGT